MTIDIFLLIPLIILCLLLWRENDIFWRKAGIMKKDLTKLKGRE